MENRIYEIIKPWAGVATWYTSHPKDRERFYQAIHRLVSELGSRIAINEFESALRRHAEGSSPTLGQPVNWDATIESFVLKAETIFGYEQERSV